MELVALLALSAIVAVVYNFVQPKIFGLSQAQSLQTNFFGVTVLTTVAVFAAILAAGWIMKFVGKATVRV